MTTEEIKNLIDQKIAGQGTMVDVGGALPTILKEIVDMASVAKPQEQSDWGQVNDENVDFIKNKPVASVIMPSNNYMVVDSIDAYKDVYEMRVGNKVYFRNDIFAKYVESVGIQANIGAEITATGAIFVRIKGRDMNISAGKAFDVEGVAVLALTPDPNPSAPPFCLAKFDTSIGSL